MTEPRLSPAQAWARLEAGNRHWVEGRLVHPDQDATRRHQVAARQDPFATIVSCIDSRLPPETIFDQGIGDLFAVRTGAQTIDGLVTASIEYGPLENGTPLIVVLGHERCGAITAAVHAIQSGAHLPGHLDAIVQRLRPAYHKATGTTHATEATATEADAAALIDQVVRAQILRTVFSLAHDGPLAGLVSRGDLGIVGAYYDLDTGLVTRLHALGLLPKSVTGPGATRRAATTERRGSLVSMGSEALPPFSWTEAVSRWQFAPVVTMFTVVMAALYLWGVVRVARRHPARPWPVPRTAAFLGGLLVVVIATQSGVGTYDDTLFWVHMIQHLMLIMVAPPLLVAGQPVTLLMHASRNPLHTWVKGVIRSTPVRWLTWPALGVAAYAATIVGTHLTSFMNQVVSNAAVHDAEHVLYLVVGYLYFLPLLGREPIRWKVSYPLRLFLLFIAMPVDAFTGVVLGSETSPPFGPLEPRSWGPSALDDVHMGGAVMWIGGAAIMFVVIMVTFLAWTRETRPSGGMGWLESARRSNLAERIAEGAVPAPVKAEAEAEAGARASREAGNVDEDDEHLAAYNAYLARLNSPAGRDPEGS